MQRTLYEDFLNTDDTLRVYEGDRLVFSSKKDRLLPLLDYLDRATPVFPPVLIFDKIMGNAAALLSIRANCREVYSPLGSQLAVETLDRRGVRHHITSVIPHILKDDGSDMCPMEKLSLGKNPDEFYRVMKARTG